MRNYIQLWKKLILLISNIVPSFAAVDIIYFNKGIMFIIFTLEKRRCIENHDDALKEGPDEAINTAEYEISNTVGQLKRRKTILKMMASGSNHNGMLQESHVSISALSNFLHMPEKLYVIRHDAMAIIVRYFLCGETDIDLGYSCFFRNNLYRRHYITHEFSS